MLMCVGSRFCSRLPPRLGAESRRQAAAVRPLRHINSDDDFIAVLQTALDELGKGPVRDAGFDLHRCRLSLRAAQPDLRLGLALTAFAPAPFGRAALAGAVLFPR